MVGKMADQQSVLHRLQFTRDSGNVEAGRGEVLHLVVVLLVDEGQREHTHANQVAAVDALKRLRDYGGNTKQSGALGGPVTTAAHAVILATDDDQLGAIGLIGHRG